MAVDEFDFLRPKINLSPSLLSLLEEAEETEHETAVAIAKSIRETGRYSAKQLDALRKIVAWHDTTDIDESDYPDHSLFLND